MTPTLPDLDADALPLDGGLRLLEASAGTGKTFTLAHLVLRLVAERELPLRELLVVTFTDAAASELRDRIGRRLQQALGCLDPARRSEPLDPVLERWWQRQEAGDATGRLRARLLLALEELAAADITTIHGFCRRCLQRQALEAGLGPGVDLDTGSSALIEQVVHDYWQQQMLTLEPELLGGLRICGVKPGELGGLLQDLESDPALELPALPPGFEPDRPLREQLEGFMTEAWRRFRREWSERGEALEAEFRAAAGELRAAGLTSTTPYSPKPTKNRVALLDAWLREQPEAGSYAAVVSQELLRGYFHPGNFSKVARRIGEEEVALPQRPLLEAVAGLVDGVAEGMLAHFCHWARRELRRRRQRSGLMGYGDLVRGLDPGPDGCGQAELIAAVRGRYRAALVDEFQDTDPVQWRILRQAFLAPGGNPHGGHLLVIVGDPKQAIYRFRGGDLDTYRAVREEAPQRVGLRHNFRAAPALIDALNRLMGPGLIRSDLEVPEAAAGGRPPRTELLLPEGESPLRLLWLGAGRAAGEDLPGTGDLDRVLPEAVGGLVLQLLEGDIQVRQGERHRRLQPHDICLLVSLHRQADMLRAALEQRGIPCRLVSQGDVFAGEGATALQRLLDALADPGSLRRQRLLAASPLLGWSPAELGAADAAAWDRLAERIQRLAGSLADAGLLAVLGDLLGSEDLARLSLSGRLLADLQQCAGLVHERMHAERLGAAAAADWLRRRRHHPPSTIPEAEMPYSDAVESAVGVVTVHRSKGLEFPVVICPYLWQGGAGKRAAGRLGRRWKPPGRGQAALGVHRNLHWGEGFRAARQDREASEQEQERLAYVAVTRSEQMLVLAYGPAKEQATNPLFPWLFPSEPLPASDDGDEGIQARSDAVWLERLQRDAAGRGLPLQLINLPPEPGGLRRWRHPAPQGTLSTGPRPRHGLFSGWGRHSYSSWAHAGAPLAPAALDEGRDTDQVSAEAEESQPLQAAAWSEMGPLAFFPRGATAGDCLHRILERVDHQRPGADAAHAELVARELERAGLDPEQREPVLVFLERLRHTPFGGALGGFQLAWLPRDRRLNEMNFDLPLAAASATALVRARDLASVFRDHPGGGFGAAYVTRLAELEVASRGFLTGSIDLVFTAPGENGHPRWWVADWKSNWLGVRDEGGQAVACGPLHYGQEAMAELMEANHYPLQAHLYLVALHRYLKWRLPGYVPERDLGGYAYVFLRGVPGPLPKDARVSPRPQQGDPVPGMFVEPAQPPRIEALDALLREGRR
jgi:exodeoxyribonuclease V beta subunit